MPTTIQQSFQRFRDDLHVTTLQEATVLTRQKNVRSVMENGLDVLESFVAGSYSRGTMIAPLKEADIDVFVIIESRYFNNYNGQNGGQAGLLDLVRRTLLRTYTRTPDISRSGQAVTIRFDDFVVDVVPGFYRQGGGLLIPNSITQSWLSTDPRKHVELVLNANRAHGDSLVPMIRMLKAWNKSHSGFFRSFHLEVLALQIFAGVTISDFPSGVRYFFDKGRHLIVGKNVDPAGFGDDVGSYINDAAKVEEASKKFQLAYERAIKAEDYARRGNVIDAVDMWIKIFGDYFP